MKIVFLIVNVVCLALLVGGCDNSKAENSRNNILTKRNIHEIKSDTIICNDGSLLILDFESEILTVRREKNENDQMQYITLSKNGKLREMTVFDGAVWKETSQGKQRIYNAQKIVINSDGTLNYALLTRDFDQVIDTIFGNVPSDKK